MLNRRWMGLIVGLGSLACLAGSLEARQGPRQYSWTAVAGATRFDETSALRDDLARTLYGGLEGRYQLTQNLGIGGFLLASRPTTDGSMFPLVRMAFRDTSIYFLPSQQLLLLEGGGLATLSVPMGPLTLLGSGGVGMYRIDLDQERSRRPVQPGTEVTNMRGLSFVVGGGFTVPVPRGGGLLRLQVRDFIYTDYDREKLSLAQPLLSSRHIPHPRQDVPEAKTTIHNLRFEAGVVFVMGGGS